MSSIHSVGRNEVIQQQIPECDVEQSQSDDYESHDSTRAEGDSQSAVERGPGLVGGASRSIGRRLHAEESGEAREETARQEGERNPFVLNMEPEGHD